MVFRLDRNDALIIVDVQKCFCSGGEIPVPEGDKIVSTLNKYVEKFRMAGATIYATRDWHPPNHRSFKEYGGIWPPHCIKGTEGAEFHSDLKLSKDASVISVGVDPFLEGFSGFENSDLEHKLKQAGINRLFVGGLATDYCVKHTVLDALEKNFQVVLLMDATKGVDRIPGDIHKAVKEMVKKGVEKANFGDIE